MDTDANPSRRRFLRSVLGVAGAVGVAGGTLGAVVGRSSSSVADDVVIDTAQRVDLARPARLSTTARRLGDASRSQPPAPAPPGRIIFPIDAEARSYVLDNYGDCRDGGGRMHIGVDIVSERGAAVFAIASGRIVHRYENSGTAGFGLVIAADDGSRYRYYHLDAFAPGAEPGQRVEFGQVVGWVGSTGNFVYVDGERVEDRNNIHLHFEYWPDGRSSVDPLPLIEVPTHIRVGPPLKSCSADFETP